MHELDFAYDIFKIAEETAKKYNAKKVKSIFLEIGELTNIFPELLKESFKIVTKDSIVENAMLDIHIISGQIKCRNCSNISDVKITDEAKLTGLQLFRCNKCDSINTEIIEGKKMNIKNIKIEE
ncbi:MAG: hydrogenase maturation nickel metallochaperone HypA [Candidatus Lokiarchaeota archaeon]|nr:hydrogenase maturation nickel metallochaperone HypA [Candidatus Lokiarchaeota archaeon]